MKSADCEHGDPRSVETRRLMMLKTSPDANQTENWAQADAAPCGPSLTLCLEPFSWKPSGSSNFLSMIYQLSLFGTLQLKKKKKQHCASLHWKPVSRLIILHAGEWIQVWFSNSSITSSHCTTSSCPSPDFFWHVKVQFCFIWYCSHISIMCSKK